MKIELIGGCTKEELETRIQMLQQQENYQDFQVMFQKF